MKKQKKTHKNKKFSSENEATDTKQTRIHRGKTTTLDYMNSKLLFLLLQQLCFAVKPPKKNDLRTSLPISKGEGRKKKLSCAAELTMELVFLVVGT